MPRLFESVSSGFGATFLPSPPIVHRAMRCRDLHQRRFSLCLFWSLDRLIREGVLETLRYLERMTSYGIAWKSYTEQYLDSAGVFKDAIISIMATLARQERIKISERTLAGLETARAKGRTLGRPRKIFDRERLVRLRNEGWSLGRLSTEFRISRTHVARIVQGSKHSRQDSSERVSEFSTDERCGPSLPYFFCST